MRDKKYCIWKRRDCAHLIDTHAPMASPSHDGGTLSARKMRLALRCECTWCKEPHARGSTWIFSLVEVIHRCASDLRRAPSKGTARQWTGRRHREAPARPTRGKTRGPRKAGRDAPKHKLRTALGRAAEHSLVHDGGERGGAVIVVRAAPVRKGEQGGGASRAVQKELIARDAHDAVRHGRRQDAKRRAHGRCPRLATDPLVVRLEAHNETAADESHEARPADGRSKGPRMARCSEAVQARQRVRLRGGCAHRVGHSSATRAAVDAAASRATRIRRSSQRR